MTYRQIIGCQTKIDKTLSTPSSLKRLLSDGYHKSFIFQVERDYKLLGVAAGLLLWTSFHGATSVDVMEHLYEITIT